MGIRKITISISEELDEALTLAFIEMASNKSRVIETFLREHGSVRAYVERIRGEPDVTVFAAKGRRKNVTASGRSPSARASPTRKPRKVR